jgi:hypothetical protein
VLEFGSFFPEGERRFRRQDSLSGSEGFLGNRFADSDAFAVNRQAIK